MPKNLLVADDSVTVRKAIAMVFSSEDVHLVSVDNGLEAVSKAKEGKPDLVLADVSMPGKGGYEVCELLKGDPETSSIPVLLMAGNAEPFDESRARAAGADGHIVKPFDSQALLDKAKALLGGALKAEPAQPAQTYRLANAAPPSAPPAPANLAPIPLQPSMVQPPAAQRPLAPAAAPVRPAFPASGGPPPPAARPLGAPPPAGGRPVVQGVSPPPPSAQQPLPRPAAPVPQAMRPLAPRPGGVPGPMARPPPPGIAPPGAPPMRPGVPPPAMGARSGPLPPPGRPPPQPMGGPPRPLGYGGPAPAQARPRDPYGLSPMPAAARGRPPMQEPGFIVEDALPVAKGAEEISLDMGHSAPAPRAPDGGEALLREALSRASKEVIEKIAWEVVPQLAETIIREQLDRLMKERQGHGPPQ